MKVLILVPEVHFYAPIVLRHLFRTHKDVNYRVLMTPKVRTDGSFLDGLTTLVRDQGLGYLANQASLRALYATVGTLKELGGISVEARREVEVSEVIEHFDVEGRNIDSVRSDEAVADVEDWEPDYLLSVFFNQIVPERVLSVPEGDALNLHPGRLPEYRGSSPVFWQLLNREERAGCALHQLTSVLDAGPLYGQNTLTVRESDSYYSLYGRLARTGAKLIVDFFETVRAGESYDLERQSESGAETYPRFEYSDLREFRARGLSFWRTRDFL